MNTKTKNILMTIWLLGLLEILLKTTSNLDYVQIGLMLVFSRIVFKSSTQKNLIKYGWTTIWLLGGIFLLGLGYLPLFETAPSSQDFASTQSRHIIVKSPSETSVISIKQQWFIKNQDIQENEKEIILKESQISIISFSNKKVNSSASMTIQYPDQTTIVIYPNSSFSLEISGNQQIIEKISGKMEYIPGNWNDIVIKKADKKQISDFAAKWLWDEYTDKQRNYILERAGGMLIENQSVRNISHTMIILASKIRPNRYLPCLENEKEYKKLLELTDSESTSYENKSNEVTKNILDQAKEGWSKTRFLQFLGN